MVCAVLNWVLGVHLQNDRVAAWAAGGSVGRPRRPRTLITRFALYL